MMWRKIFEQVTLSNTTFENICLVRFMRQLIKPIDHKELSHCPRNITQSHTMQKTIISIYLP